MSEGIHIPLPIALKKMSSWDRLVDSPWVLQQTGEAFDDIGHLCGCEAFRTFRAIRPFIKGIAINKPSQEVWSPVGDGLL